MASIRKFLRSFKYAAQGLKDLFRTQPNARVHVLVAVLVIALAVWLKVGRIDWAILLLCIFGVLTAEAFNTALEYLTDLVSPEYHQLAGKAKDAAAAAVLLSALGAVLIGLLILGPKLWLRLSVFF